ncbi:MAG: cytochrome c [Armatimonadota bacterium]|nr:cytochrome c [Armatimonadota bacterium]MDR5702511.1 cytochrome c [Armatimonadota bacterium]
MGNIQSISNPMCVAAFFGSHCTRSMRAWLFFLLVGLLLAGTVGLVWDSALAQTAEEGKALFQEKGCAACHTIGRGPLVGPDLQGVIERRERAWLTRWIKEPDKMLREGDPIATQLLREYKNVPMPNLRLTDQQVEAIINYLGTFGRPGAAAARALPSLYVPTLLAAFIALIALTALGLRMGRKQVEVR